MIVFYNNLAALYSDLFAGNYSCKEGFIDRVCLCNKHSARIGNGINQIDPILFS